MKFDAAASGEAGSPSGVRQSETRRDGRFCADIGAEPLVRIKDMPFVSRLDLVTKSLRQNDPEFARNALALPVRKANIPFRMIACVVVHAGLG